jgi:hypothetical protein
MPIDYWQYIPLPPQRRLIMVCLTSSNFNILTAYIDFSLVARHLGGLSLTATPPSYYVQPSTYNAHITTSQQYPSQYSEYMREISHLASSSMPYNDGGYWESQRNEAVRYLAHEGL